MADLELAFAPYTSEDNIVELTSEERSDYSTRAQCLKNMNVVADLIEFTCPTTLVQLWNEIDNIEVNYKKVKLAQCYALKYMMTGKHDSLLHVYSRPICGDSVKLIDVDRVGDLVLGVTCELDDLVEIHVGGFLKFTKQCNAGFNAFSRDEVVPLLALEYHPVSMKGHYVSNIIYGTILHKQVRKQLVDFYAMSNNPCMYVVQSGIDIGVKKKSQEKMDPSNLIIIGSGGMTIEQFMKHLENERVIKNEFYE